MKYNIYFDVAALVLFAVTAIVYYFKKRVPCRRNVAFGVLLAASALSAVFDILSVVTTVDKVGFHFKLFCHIVYYITHNAVPFLFFVYILLLTDNFSGISKVFRFAVYAPICVNILAILSSIFTQWIIYLDDSGEYHRGFLQPMCYVIAIYYLIFGVVYALKNRRILSAQVVRAITGFIFMTMIAVLIQLFNPSLLVECFGNAVCILLVMFTLQNQDDMIDSITKMLNRSTFINNCMINYSAGDPFTILLIRIPDFTIMMNTFGGRFINDLLSSFSEYLSSFVNLGDGYYLEDECFALTFSKDDGKVGNVYREIRSKIDSNWKIGTVDTLISASFLRIDCPGDARDVETLMDYIDQFKHMGDVTEHLLHTGEINMYDKKRRIDVERAIDRAISQRKFKVLYQPIFSNEQNKIISCEALVRMYDDDLGCVPPSEFIPIAEQNGQILKIGKFVFEEACRFIRKGTAVKLGIEYVQVNLSVVQCMQSDLVEQLMNIMDSYKVDPSQICLEITETAAVYSPQIMERNIRALSESGVKFALDDYGTGYSNINYLLNLPFRFIKLEKEIVWACFKSEKAHIAIESIIAMIKKLNMKIVAEGIETQEQLKELIHMNCDFIQGYYFSRPIDEEEFIETVRKLNCDTIEV